MPELADDEVRVVAVEVVVGVIQFQAVIPSSATGFIEINYSQRPHAYSRR